MENGSGSGANSKPSAPAKNYLTPEGLARLQSEYHQLHSVERPRIVETVAWAASNGDRSENADYIYGKRRLREIDSRLRFLLKKIESAEVVDPTQIQSDRILFGALVQLEREDGSECSYQIVGETESDPKQSRISWKSPLATALLGKREGDEVIFRKPKGEEVFVVLKVQYPK
jgi:transcription elongation factor GreB